MASATDSDPVRWASEAGFSASHDHPARDKPVLALLREYTSRKGIAPSASRRGISPSPSTKRLTNYAKHCCRTRHWFPVGCVVGDLTGTREVEVYEREEFSYADYTGKVIIDGRKELANINHPVAVGVIGLAEG